VTHIGTRVGTQNPGMPLGAIGGEGGGMDKHKEGQYRQRYTNDKKI